MKTKIHEYQNKYLTKRVTKPLKIVHMLIILGGMTCFFCCSNDDASATIGAFELIDVADNATSIDVFPTFRWEEAMDVNGDTMTYDLYVGTEENPTTPYAEDLTATEFLVTQRLDTHSTYYWKVIAKNENQGALSSATFSFATRGLNVTNVEIPNAYFSPRAFHKATAFKDELWVIGGFDGQLKNDVWHSSDGIEWTMSVNTSVFVPRSAHTSSVFDGKLWVIGGYASTPQTFENDVWFSNDGMTWEFATINAEFPGRQLHTTTVFDGKLWVIGGIDATSAKNDVWYSTDGATWMAANNNAEFTPRSGHATTVFDNKMWVIGGRNTGGELLNDVWFSTDGITWSEATNNAAFTARTAHTANTFDNKLWVIGGFDDINKNDVWYSKDGSTWLENTTDASFRGRFGHSSTIFKDKIWMIGGSDNSVINDIWTLD